MVRKTLSVCLECIIYQEIEHFISYFALDDKTTRFVGKNMQKVKKHVKGIRYVNIDK